MPHMKAMAMRAGAAWQGQGRCDDRLVRCGLFKDRCETVGWPTGQQPSTPT
jgi:hypothetical protein